MISSVRWARVKLDPSTWVSFSVMVYGSLCHTYETHHSIYNHLFFPTKTLKLYVSNIVKFRSALWGLIFMCETDLSTLRTTVYSPPKPLQSDKLWENPSLPQEISPSIHRDKKLQSRGQHLSYLEVYRNIVTGLRRAGVRTKDSGTKKFANTSHTPSLLV